MHHHVDHAVLVQVFGALESIGQLFADRVLDHPLAGKADQRARFGDVHVAEHGVARRNAACGRVGQHDDIGQLGFLEAARHHGCLGHLHQAENAFLHTRATRSGDDDIGAMPRQRALRALAEGGAHRHAHRSAHEAEVLHTNDCRLALDRARSDEEGVLVRALGARLFQTVGVFRRIAELERVFLHIGDGEDVEALVEQLPQPLVGADPAMMAAARADIGIVFIFLREDHLLAAGAFDPQVFLGAALGQRSDRIADAGEPVHAMGL